MLGTVASVLKMTCPKCHKGKLFINPNPFNFSTLTQMPETCRCCGQPNQPEPGFYYGAPYISYMICIAFCFINYFLFESIFGISGTKFLIANSLVLLILWPIIFRYARSVFIHLFIKYDPKASKNCK